MPVDPWECLSHQDLTAPVELFVDQLTCIDIAQPPMVGNTAEGCMRQLNVTGQ